MTKPLPRCAPSGRPERPRTTNQLYTSFKNLGGVVQQHPAAQRQHIHSGFLKQKNAPTVSRKQVASNHTQTTKTVRHPSRGPNPTAFLCRLLGWWPFLCQAIAGSQLGMQLSQLLLSNKRRVRAVSYTSYNKNVFSLTLNSQFKKYMLTCLQIGECEGMIAESSWIMPVSTSSKINLQTEHQKTSNNNHLHWIEQLTPSLQNTPHTRRIMRRSSTSKLHPPRPG